MTGVGVTDLGNASEDGPSFSEQQLLNALVEAGINPELLTPQQMAELRQDMILDPTPFDEKGALLGMLRGLGGFEDALSDVEEREAAKLAKKKAAEEEAEKGDGRSDSLANVMGACLAGALGISFGGDANSDELHPEFGDGFNPDPITHEAPPPGYYAMMSTRGKKKPASS